MKQTISIDIPDRVLSVSAVFALSGASSSSEFDPLAEHLLPLGIPVAKAQLHGFYGCDLEMMRRLSYGDVMKSAVEDLGVYREALNARGLSDHTILLVGHSTGANLLMDFAAHEGRDEDGCYQGLLAGAPILDPKGRFFSFCTRAYTNPAGRLVVPAVLRYLPDHKKRPTAGQRIPAETLQYHRTVDRQPATYAWLLAEAVKRAREARSRIKMATTILAPEEDHYSRLNGHSSGADVRSVGGGHYLFLERFRYKVFQYVADWALTGERPR